MPRVTCSPKRVSHWRRSSRASSARTSSSGHEPADATSSRSTSIWRLPRLSSSPHQMRRRRPLLHPDKDTHWSYKNSDLFKQCRSCGDLSYHTMLECHGRLHEETSGVLGNGCGPRQPFGLCLLLGRSVRSPVPSTAFATTKKHRRRRREFPFHIELEPLCSWTSVLALAGGVAQGARPRCSTSATSSSECILT